MVRLEEHKHITENRLIDKIPIPQKAYISLSQHLGKVCSPQVKIGDVVLRGQKIAMAQAHIYASIHSSISGKVSAICDWPHPLLGKAKAVVIESDGLDKSCSTDSRSKEEIDKLTPEQIRNIVFEAGIVGMGGAAFPTHIKLTPPKPVDTLIINGAECEPYLTGDYRLMMEKTGEIIQGVEVAARCLGVKNVFIAIEDNKPEAIKAFRNKLESLHIIPPLNLNLCAGSRSPVNRLSGAHYALRILKTMYPQGGEKQLVKNILGKEIPRGKLPFDIGVVVHNVATVFAIYEAVYLNKPLYERVVTVTGSCLSNPKNVLARLGTPIRELIEFCGPLKEEPAKIIIGGPMMGIAQFSDEVPVIKSSTGILLFSQKEADLAEEIFCIRCGACARECPVGLMPCMINLASEKALWNETRKYGSADCIECGLCNYVCPANRRLVQSIKRAKLEIVK